MSNAPRCPETGLPMVRAVRREVVTFKGRSREIDMPGWYCDASGESIHTRDDMKVSDRALAELKAEALGVAAPSEVERVRKTLKLSKAKASRIFGGGQNAFQKYEKGEVLPSRPMTMLLRLAERHPHEALQMAAELDAKERSAQQA